MGKYEKLFQQWYETPPSHARKDEVLNLARHYGLNIRMGKGSHFIIKDERLKCFHKHLGYTIMNDGMTIPVVGGHQVKGIYVWQLVQFIRFIEECNE